MAARGYLKPNGVFFIDNDGGHIVDAEAFPTTSQNVRLATQSGPLLLIDRTINVKLLPDSANRKIRSGVGTAGSHGVFFVISNQSTTFYDLTTVFRDDLHCSDALYLDGVISRFYVAGNESAETVDGNFAGIFAVVAHQVKAKKD